MKTLLQICAAEINEWNDAWMDIQQASSGAVISRDELKNGYILFWAEIASDHVSAIVTRTQWKEARADHLKSVDENGDPFAKCFTKSNPSDVRCAIENRKKQDQALWDEAAIAAINALTIALPGEIKGLDWKRKVVLAAHEIAGIHMAEREKRMEGKA